MWSISIQHMPSFKQGILLLFCSFKVMISVVTRKFEPCLCNKTDLWFKLFSTRIWAFFRSTKDRGTRQRVRCSLYTCFDLMLSFKRSFLNWWHVLYFLKTLPSSNCEAHSLINTLLDARFHHFHPNRYRYFLWYYTPLPTLIDGYVLWAPIHRH